MMEVEGEELDELAELMGVERNPDESDSEFRERVQESISELGEINPPEEGEETVSVTHRTAEDYIKLIRRYCKSACDEWDDEWVRNAGDITLYETEMRVVFKVPLPYFHHAGLTPDDVQASIKRHFPPTTRVCVDMLPPPSQRE